MFWDGRATGWTLGDPLAEQAMGPFLNPLEQNMPDNKAVVQKVVDSDYADLFREVWGEDSLNIEDPDATYEKIARSIAATSSPGSAAGPTALRETSNQQPRRSYTGLS